MRAAAGPGPGPAQSLRWRIVGSSLAASLLTLLVVLPVAWRLRAAAEAKINDNAAPVAMIARPTNPPEIEPPDLAEPAPVRVRDIPAGQLAQADPVKPPADPPSAADATAGARSGTPARFDYDLELWTPMPPDGRDEKPVY